MTAAGRRCCLVGVLVVAPTMAQRALSQRDQGPSPTIAAVSPPATCTATQPNGQGLRHLYKYTAGNHGDGTSLATWLSADGTVPLCVSKDGSLRKKWRWWRGGRGPLDIEGRRLDGASSALRARIPKGYGQTGFQSSSLIFPTPGCWEVTGRVGATRLSFVVLITKVDSGPGSPCAARPGGQDPGLHSYAERTHDGAEWSYDTGG